MFGANWVKIGSGVGRYRAGYRQTDTRRRLNLRCLRSRVRICRETTDAILPTNRPQPHRRGFRVNRNSVGSFLMSAVNSLKKSKTRLFQPETFNEENRDRAGRLVGKVLGSGLRQRITSQVLIDLHQFCISTRTVGLLQLN